MACSYCHKQDVVKRYMEMRLGKEYEEMYCGECYQKLFLYTESAKGGDFTTCPYCGTTLEEFKRTKLVGCAHCYRTMSVGVAPIVIKMQDSRKAHVGKTPPIDFVEDPSLGDFSEENRLDAVTRARFKRQCTELEIIINKLMAAKDYDGAKGYGDKLSQMRSSSGLEVDFVWRERQNKSSKQP